MLIIPEFEIFYLIRLSIKCWRKLKENKPLPYEMN